MFQMFMLTILQCTNLEILGMLQKDILLNKKFNNFEKKKRSNFKYLNMKHDK